MRSGVISLQMGVGGVGVMYVGWAAVADLRGGREGRTPPPLRPNSFNFMQFLGEFGKIACSRPPPWRVHAPPPPLGEILDPSLGCVFFTPWRGYDGIGPGGGLSTYTHTHYRLDCSCSAEIYFWFKKSVNI